MYIALIKDTIRAVKSDAKNERQTVKKMLKFNLFKK